MHGLKKLEEEKTKNYQKKNKNLEKLSDG